MPSSAPNSRDGSVDADDSVTAADHRLIQDFLARRDGADDAMALRLAIIPRILGGLCRRLGFPLKPHDIEDTAQDATAVALRKLGELKPDVPLDAWLHRLCSFELSNSLRRGNRRRGEEISDSLPTRDANALQQIERRELLFVALGQLRREDADIVCKHQLEGRTLAEIAASTGHTENTIKGRYYRAIERLTETLRHHRPGAEES